MASETKAHVVLISPNTPLTGKFDANPESFGKIFFYLRKATVLLPF